jgi:ATP-binding cassette, subfamily B, bacterial
MRALLKILYVISRGHRMLFASSVLANLLVAQFPVALAYLSKVIIDSLFSHSGQSLRGSPRSPLFWGTVYLLLLALQYVGQMFLLFLNETLSEASTRNIHVEIMKAGIRIEGLTYFDDPAFHDHRARLENNAIYIPAGFLRCITDVCSISVTLLGMVILLAGLHPLIPLLIVFSCIPDLVAQKRMHRLIYEGVKETAQQERLKEYYRSVLLTSESAKEVRMYDLKDFFVKKYQGTVEHIMQILAAMRKRQIKYSVLCRIVLAAGTVAPYLWTIRETLQGRISPGQLVMFMTAIVVVQQQLSRGAQTYAAHQEIGHWAQDLAAWLRMESDLKLVTPQNAVARRVQEPPHIRIEDLWFKYPGASDFTLKGLTLEVEKGKSLAVVGSNGSGKSTLVKLLCRLYDPQSGSVYYDDVDIRTIRLSDLRGSAGVIFQDFVRYQLTVRENIALQEPSCLKSVYSAAVAAGADDFIDNLPHSYETLLSKQFPGGEELSGGQWQRLALARAFYRDVGMLILDEPTASVDIAMEARIYHDFQAITEGKTTLLISHRLSTVRMADRIAVVHDGKIAEFGDHDSLMALRGIYHNMFLSQAERYKLTASMAIESLIK